MSFELSAVSYELTAEGCRDVGPSKIGNQKNSLTLQEEIGDAHLRHHVETTPANTSSLTSTHLANQVNPF